MRLWQTQADAEAGGRRGRQIIALAAIAVLVMLLIVSVVSHEVPLSLGFKALVIGVPLVLVAGAGIRFVLLVRSQSLVKISWLTILKSAGAVMTVVIITLGAGVFVSNTVGNSSGCPAGIAGVCYKTDGWKIQDGKYYVSYVSNQQGADNSVEPWTEISESEYLSGAGADLRQAIDFGVGVALFTYLMTLIEGAARRRGEFSDGI
jgi:hypothetical protein